MSTSEEDSPHHTERNQVPDPSGEQPQESIPGRQIDVSAAADLFSRLRGRMRRSFSRPRRPQSNSDDSAEPFGPKRDPRALGNVVGELSQTLGWDPFLADSELLLGWSELVGEDVSAHTTPEDIQDGILRVTCSSTAWATQLRLLSPEIMARIANAFPEAKVTELQFRGPNQPSWKHGPRTVPGRGPRDTYG